MKQTNEYKPAALKEREAYRAVIQALGRRRGGATAADISAASAVPLAAVRELLPRAADEYQGRLQVTESGEIIYSFPQGFTSRYRGFWAGLKRFSGKLGSGLAWLGSLLFKVWIMVMLVGYFALFMALALLSVFAAVAGNSRNSSSRRGGGAHFSFGLLDLFIRLWFYSELTKPARQYGGYGNRKPQSGPSRPLHRAIFAFVFGDADPNQDWTAREKKAVIAYIQARRGVIALPELMALTGKNSAEAEKAVMACCSEFGGVPEATEAGTIVYRFDELLARTGTNNSGTLQPPVRRLKPFSENPKSMNTWFGIINTVNLLFGSYFVYHAFNTGAILSTEQLQSTSFLYGFVYAFLGNIAGNPLSFISIGLGLVPLAFSLLFWLIPALRFFREKKENENTKLGNLKRLGFSMIWSDPLKVDSGSITSQADECRPHNMAAAQERVIKDMGAYSVPEVAITAAGGTVYSFTELEREKMALEQYREGIDIEKAGIGKTVFDSGA
ncbi:MAG: hypothetical protein LBD48_04085 [Treponema sp.]|jgi:hypothetical protein|nr:hypothetical protein [Treponema sp.]